MSVVQKPSETPAPVRDAGRRPDRIASAWEQVGMLAVLALLFIGCAVFVPNFLSRVNMQGLLLAVSTVGMVACTMLFCLAAGSFDLSVSSVVACAGVIAAVVIRHTDSTFAGIGAALAAGGFVGLVNGVVVAKAKINALITTLATMQIVRGVAYIVSDGKAVGVTRESFFQLGNTEFLGLATPVWLCLACFLVFGFLLGRTTFGRNTLAIGGNEEAARLAGIAVDGVKIAIFAIQGLVAAFAGVVLASRMTSGQPMSSMGFELEVISACVLGGVSLTGGVGRISYVVAGVLIMGIVQNAMNLQNVPPFYQYVARGAILLGAVLFDRVRQRRA
jgi:L-arabinose transport system permease protein